MNGYLLILPFLIFTQMIIFYLHTDFTDLTDLAPSELVRSEESAVDYDLV